MNIYMYILGGSVLFYYYIIVSSSQVSLCRSFYVCVCVCL